MKIVDKARQYGRRVMNALTPSETAWRGATTGVYLLGTTVISLLFVAYFLQDFTVQKLPAFVVWIGMSVAVGMASILLAWLIMLLPLPFRFAVAAFLPFLLLSVFPGGEQTATVGAFALVLIFSMVGGALAIIRSDGFSFAENKTAPVVLVIGLAGLIGGLYAIFSDVDPVNPVLDDYVLENKTLDLPNPGLPGDYGVVTLTYGSGKDLRRPEYGEEVNVVARSVDGTKLIDNWEGFSGWLRTSYWGFDVTELPLQARVWMPDGEGPFPLVLVVHGNHGMEDFSDPGYDYLGEHFASRGIILASVDENFINSSISARVDIFADRPGLREENDAKGWLLLEHLAQWRDWNEESGHQFEGLIDMDRVALIGHSRGGEAVGIAAAFNSLDRYPDDATVDFDFGFNLRGVIAIAPVYGQYEPRERPTPVRDVNYFTIHGDMDGDVQSFEGIAQYSRVSFPGDEFRFRSSLYVVGANHGQFNTTWENMDTGIYRAWDLDLGRIMDPEAQRDVARVYFTAFLEVVMNDRTEYLPIFRDSRFAADWLPQTFFINQFSDSNERELVSFEDDIDPTTTRLGRIETSYLSRWYETGNELKYDELDTHSLVAAWDEKFSEETARIDFLFDAPVTGDTLIASLSAIDIGTMPKDWEDDESDEAKNEEDEADETDEEKTLDWTIEVADSTGAVASLPLSHDAALYPLVNAVPRRAGFLDSADETEILFRRFEFPLAAFEGSGGQFNAGEISRISFVFDRSKKGAIILDSLSMSEGAQ